MDELHAAVPGCAAVLPVMPEGEVWVAMPYKPAFPGIIPADETPPGVIEDQTRFPVLHNPDNDVEVGLRCRPTVARWIGIHLEAFYGTASTASPGTGTRWRSTTTHGTSRTNPSRV
ncbi:hypothetical protein [Amycolatopsis sp. cmx-4-54]|uniref:hypothetical protein n=1 Tax=Amycolatopsis sp. cmx-4-54 TaxID=2790936 RepID=UPI00397D5083